VTIVYRVKSSSTKSTTLTFTDIGFQKSFKKRNRTPKGSSNFGNVGAYLFVDTIVTIVYRVVSSSTKSTTLAFTNIGFQFFLKWNRTPKGSSNFGNVRVYLFVSTITTIVYRVMSSSTRSTTLAFTDIGFQKKFSKWNRTPKGLSNFGNMRVYLFVSTPVNPKSFQTL
jgi:uncharacterized membrane protein YobD (UPF0266 family)